MTDRSSLDGTRPRKASGFTLQEAAARSDGGFRPTSIACYERGERSISLARFCRLAEVYGVSPGELLVRALQRFEPTPVDVGSAPEDVPSLGAL